MNNPLLTSYIIPAFDQIRAEHFEPAIDQLLEHNRQAIAELLQSEIVYTWDNLVRPLAENEDCLNRAWSTIAHLHAVADSDPVRTAYNACLPKLTEYASETGQNEALFRAYKQLAEGNEFAQLDRAQQKLINNTLRDFHLAGIGLEKSRQQRFREIQQRLSTLQTSFEQNTLDATQAWSTNITDREKLEGIPQTVLTLAGQTARQRSEDGWTFTLDAPSAIPVMQYAENSTLRKEFYDAYVTRASETGPYAGQYDNGEVMVEILRLRREKAELLGYESFAGYSLVCKMAESPDQVAAFLHDLARRSRKVAQQEFAQLQDFSQRVFGVDTIEAWDVAYYSEKYRQHQFNFSREEIKPYFPVNRVLTGMFAVANKLFNTTISERTGISTWDPEVRFFDIHGPESELRGSFFLDLYARPRKRGGAWMDDCVTRKKTRNQVQLPVAFLICNFTPPVDEQPSLLTHDEVLTLFHEFGHGLHHMLTMVDYPAVAGINGVAWDAVELPSQFMENWCWEQEALELISGHYQTGAPLPVALFDKMLRARTFQAGMQMVRQLEFALFDLQLHYNQIPGSTAEIQQLLDTVRKEVAVIIPPAYNRFQNSFSHIFAGGYAAGYYSYKWAEVLSADAFSRFEETGIFNRQTGLDFLHSILEQGGSRDPMELFREFRGREPDIEPLLRHSGILGNTVGVDS
jgi:oligopeptidase A